MGLENANKAKINLSITHKICKLRPIEAPIPSYLFHAKI